MCELITDGTHQTPQYTDKGYIFLSSKNVTSGKIDWDNVKYIPEGLHNELYKRLKPKKGDILLAKNGTTGVAALVDRDEIFDIYVSLALLRPKKGIFAPYLLAVINSPYVKRQFDRSLKGIGVPNLHLKEIKKTVIPIPPFNIQKHIANTLDKTQEIIDGYKKQHAELDNLIKAVFYEMFQEYYHDKKMQKLLREICTFIDYRGKTPEKSNSGIPLITAKNIKNNTFSVEPREFIPKENYDKVMTRGIPKANDVIFTTEAPLGNVCRIPKVFSRFAVGQRIIVMQPKKDLVTSEYLEHALASEQFQKEMLKRSSGSTVRGIRSKELLQLAICIPPIHLQLEFTKIVTKIEEQKTLVKQAITESEQLFNSLMSEYFE